MATMVKRIESRQIEEKAVLFVEEIFNEANWVCNRLYRDFGVDLHVKVFESAKSRKAMPWEFHVQIKGTRHLRISKSHIHFVIDTEHLKDWYEALLPVLFVICDVQNSKAYWLWIKEYLDKLSLDWQEQSTITLRISINNQLKPEILPQLCTELRRSILIHEARKVVGLVEEPDEITKSPFGFNSPYYRPLPELDQSIENPALARCLLCGNYFWIEKSVAIAWEFLKIYEPSGYEPAVYDCDAPEEFCPVCLSGEGALRYCKNCGRYAVYPLDDIEDEEWDNHLITLNEAKQLCHECFEDLIKSRERKSKNSSNFI